MLNEQKEKGRWQSNGAYAKGLYNFEIIAIEFKTEVIEEFLICYIINPESKDSGYLPFVVDCVVSYLTKDRDILRGDTESQDKAF